MHDSNERPAVTKRTMEMGFAVFTFTLGALAMYDSARIGFGWSSDGPESGSFPFYVGSFVCITAIIIFIIGLRDKKAATQTFVTRSALVLVLKVLIPTIVYTILIGYLGIYLSSAIFISFFMWWIGKYSVWKIAPIAILVPVIFFLLFERWFFVPLPKGPLEAALGLL